MTPAKIISTPKMTLDITAVSRTRSGIAAPGRPSPVHEKEHTATASASGSQVDGGSDTRSSSAPSASDDQRTTKPLTMTGSARPRNSGTRLAGEASSSGSVLRALAADGVAHREQARDGRD